MFRSESVSLMCSVFVYVCATTHQNHDTLLLLLFVHLTIIIANFSHDSCVITKDLNQLNYTPLIVILDSAKLYLSLPEKVAFWTYF